MNKTSTDAGQFRHRCSIQSADFFLLMAQMPYPDQTGSLLWALYPLRPVLSYTFSSKPRRLIKQCHRSMKEISYFMRTRMCSRVTCLRSFKFSPFDFFKTSFSLRTSVVMAKSISQLPMVAQMKSIISVIQFFSTAGVLFVASHFCRYPSCSWFNVFEARHANSVCCIIFHPLITVNT